MTLKEYFALVPQQRDEVYYTWVQINGYDFECNGEIDSHLIQKMLKEMYENEAAE